MIPARRTAPGTGPIRGADPLADAIDYALARTSPSTAGSLDRYKPPDTLLAFLDNL